MFLVVRADGRVVTVIKLPEKVRPNNCKKPKTHYGATSCVIEEDDGCSDSVVAAGTSGWRGVRAHVDGADGRRRREEEERE